MSDNNQTTAGWIIFIAALGSMFGLISIDMVRLESFNQALTPAFIGSVLGHVSTVIGAFIGGKLIPTERSPDGRVTDKKIQELNDHGNTI